MPTKEQLAPMMALSRGKVLVSAGEGAGKSWAAGEVSAIHLVYDVVVNGLDDKGKANANLYWVIGESYEDAYKDWHDMLEVCEKLGIVAEGSVHIRDNGKDMCDFTTIYGQFVESRSGDDPTTIARLEPHGIIGAEASRWSAELWRRVWGRLARRERYGSWGFFSGSPESNVGPFADWYRLASGPNRFNIRSFAMPTWSNTYVYPGGYDDPAIQALKAITPEDRFNERYGGVPSAPRNAVLQEFSFPLHVDDSIDYVDGVDTYIFIDPGDIAYAVLFVQVVGSEIRVVEGIYAHRSTHDAVIAEAKMMRGWKYTQHTRRIIIDVAGYQHHNDTSTSYKWMAATGYYVSGEKYKVEALIDKLRSTLMVNPHTGRPRLRIHPRVVGLLAEAGAIANPIPGRGMWTRFSESGRPREDSNDAWKALGYGLLGLFGTDMPVETYDDYVPANPNDRPTGHGASYLKWRMN